MSMNTNPLHENLMKELLELRERLESNSGCIRHYKNCVLDSVGVSVIASDAQGKVIYLNKKAEEIFNIQLEDVDGKSFINVFPQAISYIDQEHIRELCKRRESWEGEFEVYGPNGIILTLHTVDTPVYDNDMNYQGMICVLYDISEKKLANKALIESEEKYRNVVNNTIEGIFIIQGENIVYFNSRALEMMGYTENEAFSKKFTEFVSSEDLAKVMENYKERLGGKKMDPYDLCLIKGNKDKIWVSLNATLIKWNNHTAILCFISDISYRKKQEEELKNTVTTLKAMIENSADYIMIADREGKPVMYNENYKNIIEKSLGIEMQPGLRPHKIHLDKNITKYWDEIHERVLTGEKFKEEITLLIDGKKNIYEFSFVPLIEDNKVLGFCEYAREITTAKKYEKELKKAKEKAEESDRLKSAFLANMSHEIRTPMNGIIGFSDLLIRPDLPREKYALYADTLRSSCYQLLSIVNDILDISRIETGQIMLRKEEISVNKILNDLYKIYKPSAEDAGLDIYVECGLSDDEGILYTDMVRLRQVLVNLIGNALKYTNKGYIKFGYVKENNVLKFYVEDTGIGIDKDMHYIVFERFRQADVGLAKKFSGTGLGLSISKGFVELLGGEIGVESVPEKGSNFFFTLPYSPLKSKKAIKTKPEPHVEIKANKSIMILVAEDEEINFLLMKEVINSNLKDAIVMHARDGIEAIKMVDDYPNIDIVFMDIKMPNMNGYEATGLIKKLRPNLPVIAITAYAMPEDEKLSKDAGCDEYIAKPISAEKLFEIVNRLLI
ncbi:MAG: PAS domain S-box protein [Bacteroidales bacterium]|nr:PAS domain S-box protein [Bacteroidales bacterium]